MGADFSDEAVEGADLMVERMRRDAEVLELRGGQEEELILHVRCVTLAEAQHHPQELHSQRHVRLAFTPTFVRRGCAGLEELHRDRDARWQGTGVCTKVREEQCDCPWVAPTSGGQRGGQASRRGRSAPAAAAPRSAWNPA
jgi:hypothetical protein